MTAKVLSERQQATFKAMWNAKRTCAAIGLALGISVKQVKTMRPALGLPARNQGGRVRVNVELPPDALAALTERARVLQMPRQRYLAIVLEREAKAA